ncbi:hypothetical protein Tco_1122351 [Tanacetum coccineum]|uniref:Uncharacterized protein n=1 Tax=Tanacetum coccineum TaxID=301880 RepID=A0ABQ5J099_9ASTR
MVKRESPKLTKVPNICEASNLAVVSRKYIQVIDLSDDDEVPVLVTLKRRRLLKDGTFANKHVVDILSCDEENMVPLSRKKIVEDDTQKDKILESDDESPITFTRSNNKLRPSSSKRQKFIDEDKIDVNSSQQTTKDVLYYDHHIDKEDEFADFIDDSPIDDDATSDEDTDDDF